MIKVENVSKSYGNLQAVKNLSFEVKKGEAFGFLGPNGAGKSTSIHILSSLITSDSGSIYLDNLDLNSNLSHCKNIVGIVPQDIALYEDLSAIDNLLFWGGLYDIPKSELKNRISEVIKLVGLEDRINHRIKTFSGGMKRRINIASSILHNPKILLLDEPTVGVDPQSRNHIFELIEKLKSEGMTIIYTTHYMEEAERLCDQIAIIDQGSIVANGNLDELRQISNSNDELIITVNELSESHNSILKKECEIENNQLFFKCQDLGKELTRIVNLLQENKISIHKVDTRQANLESIFLKLTGKQLRD